MHILTWPSQHNDPEWRWILQETADTLAKRGPLSYRSLATELGKMAALTLQERDPLLKDLTGEDLLNVARAIVKRKPQDWVATAPLKDLVNAMSEAFLLHAATLHLGIPSPYAKVEAEYWPFGQEGGFCNPIKLKLMADDA